MLHFDSSVSRLIRRAATLVVVETGTLSLGPDRRTLTIDLEG